MPTSLNKLLTESLTCEEISGRSDKPYNKALMYKPVPPTIRGTLPNDQSSLILSSANLTQLDTENA